VLSSVSRRLLAGTHTGHSTTLSLSPGALVDVTMVEVVDLTGLEIISDVLSVSTQCSLDAEDELPMGTLGHEWGRRAISAGLMGRARGLIVPDSQESSGGAAACALETVTLCIDPRKGRDDGRQGDKACTCTVDRAVMSEQGGGGGGGLETGAVLGGDIWDGMAQMAGRGRG
jgi:hypothetical protein